MDKVNLVEVLKNLAKGERRSEMAKLREVFSHIEDTLQAGASRADVIDALHEQGFQMKSRSFHTALYRLRSEKNRLPHREVRTLKIAGVEVVSPTRFVHNPTTDNDLLK